MTRDELLDNLAMELAEWPIEPVGARAVAFRPASEYVIEIDGCKAIAFSYDQYLQRRAELINRPSWDDAPEWAQWLAQDVNGEWYFYPIQPTSDGVCNGGQWQHDGLHIAAAKFCGEGAIPAGHDWRQTLERRPFSSVIKRSPSLVAHFMDPDSETRCMDCGDRHGEPHHHNCVTHEMDEAHRAASNPETRHDCQRCGGSYYTPPHDECHCSKEAEAPGHEGLKFDTGKPRMELLIQGMPRALEAVGQVLTFGAKKYAAHNWKLVDGAEDRYWAAKCRHELSRARGEDKDPETGLLHLAHEATNALFLLELALANQADDKT